jgi:hypothetical protein
MQLLRTLSHRFFRLPGQSWWHVCRELVLVVTFRLGTLMVSEFKPYHARGPQMVCCGVAIAHYCMHVFLIRGENIEERNIRADEGQFIFQLT